MKLGKAKQQMYSSIAVGLMGLLVGLLQGSSKRWSRNLTLGVGFCASAITIYTNKAYPADYRTLQRSAAEAEPVTVALSGYLLM